MLTAIGRRGAFLLFLAVLSGVRAFSILTDQVLAARTVNLTVPWHAWGWLWAITAAVCTWYAFRQRDRPAFVLGAMLMCCWSLAFMRAGLAQHVPRWWAETIDYAAFSAVAMLVAGWAEPQQLRRHGGHSAR